MNKATVPFHNRIALIFDFDETLAPDTFTALLDYCGLDPEQFQTQRIEPLLENGWDKKLARFHCLIEESRRRDDLTITADTFAEVGQNLALYPEVEQMFARVRKYAQNVVPDVEVEFYLLTAGMLEIPRATAVASEFRTMWGGELHFDDQGELAFVKRTVSYPDKIRYILKLGKGLDIDDPKINHDVYRYMPEDEWYVPLSQIIYVGDGDSDMPAFAFVRENEGIAIGVFQSDSAASWESHNQMTRGRRVQNLAPADAVV